MKILIFDCEIINCIPPKHQSERNPKLNYCEGWRDFPNMGISVIGTWRNFDLIKVFGEYYTIPLPWGKYEAFVNEQSLITAYSFPEIGVKDFDKFFRLAMVCDRLVGFNSHAFDDRLCQANGIEITSDFDLLGEIRVASGQPAHYVKGLTRAGYSLEKLAQANLGYGKTGTGAFAPELWQLGKKEDVINYCLNDIQITKDIYFRFMRGNLKDPTTGEKLSYFQ